MKSYALGKRTEQSAKKLLEKAERIAPKVETGSEPNSYLAPSLSQENLIHEVYYAIIDGRRKANCDCMGFSKTVDDKRGVCLPCSHIYAVEVNYDMELSVSSDGKQMEAINKSEETSKPQRGTKPSSKPRRNGNFFAEVRYESEFAEKVKRTNEVLRKFGKSAITHDPHNDRYGYKNQYLIEAVNLVFGPENFRVDELVDERKEIVEERTYKGETKTHKEVATAVIVYLRNGPEDEWHEHRGHGGVNWTGLLGDARKGAFSNAIGKALSLFDIGTDSYKGKLQKVYKKI